MSVFVGIINQKLVDNGHYLDEILHVDRFESTKILLILTEPRGMAQGGDISDSLPTPVPL